MRGKLLLLLIGSLLLFIGFGYGSEVWGEQSGQIILSSPAFDHEGMIPRQYTCDGPDISPPLTWSSVPKSTRSLALICDDPDAPVGTWVHWVLFNLPPSVTKLPQDMVKKRVLPNGAAQGLNDFRRYGYGGPCPPGGTHRYYFKIYALDKKLILPAKATKADVLNAIRGHVLAEGELMGKYRR